MHTLCKKCCGLVTAGLLLALAGCSPSASALSKFQSGQIGALTAVEWQALAGLGSSFGLTVPPLSDQQAQAVVEFLDHNNIETTSELQAAIESGTLEVPQELANLFFTAPI